MCRSWSRWRRKYNGNFAILIEQKDQLENQLDFDEENEDLLSELSTINEQIDYISNSLIESYMEESNIEAAIEVLDMENTKYSLLKKFGLAMSINDFDSAENILSSIENTTEDDAIFKDIQTINLKRLRNNEDNMVSVSDSLELESIAASESGVRSYAKSILGVMYGRHFTYEFPDVPNHSELKIGNEDESLKSVNELVKVIASPNPFKDEMTLGTYGFDTDYTIEIYNAIGQKVSTIKMSEEQNSQILYTSNWNSGIYFLHFVDKNSKLITVKKVIKQ